MSLEIDPQLRSFIQSLPKTEMHLHFEGALPWELLQSLDAERFKNVPDSWGNDFKFRSFAHFEEELLANAFSWYTSPERYHEAGKIIFQRLVDQNVRYVETSFASGAVEFLGIPAEETLAAIHEAAPPGLEVRVFFGIHHNGFTPAVKSVIEGTPNWKQLAGVDLHGVESLALEPWTAEVWAANRAAGKMNKAHAGEFCGADFVSRVLDELQVKRIEHGVRAVEDSALVQRLADEDVTLDVCPISNVKLDVFDSYETHSLRQLVDAGVRCTVSTDDPVSFGNTLTEDYAVLVQRMGFAQKELIQIARNGFDVALLDDATKAACLAELDQIAASE